MDAGPILRSGIGVAGARRSRRPCRRAAHVVVEHVRWDGVYPPTAVGTGRTTHAYGVPARPRVSGSSGEATGVRAGRGGELRVALVDAPRCPCRRAASRRRTRKPGAATRQPPQRRSDGDDDLRRSCLRTSVPAIRIHESVLLPSPPTVHGAAAGRQGACTATCHTAMPRCGIISIRNSSPRDRNFRRPRLSTPVMRHSIFSARSVAAALIAVLSFAVAMVSTAGATSPLGLSAKQRVASDAEDAVRQRRRRAEAGSARRGRHRRHRRDRGQLRGAHPQP